MGCSFEVLNKTKVRRTVREGKGVGGGGGGWGSYKLSREHAPQHAVFVGRPIDADFS